MAVITGGIAEAYYGIDGIPQELKDFANKEINEDMKLVIMPYYLNKIISMVKV